MEDLRIQKLFKMSPLILYFEKFSWPFGTLLIEINIVIYSEIQMSPSPRFGLWMSSTVVLQWERILGGYITPRIYSCHRVAILWAGTALWLRYILPKIFAVVNVRKQLSLLSYILLLQNFLVDLETHLFSSESQVHLSGVGLFNKIAQCENIRGAI